MVGHFLGQGHGEIPTGVGRPPVRDKVFCDLLVRDAGVLFAQPGNVAISRAKYSSSLVHSQLSTPSYATPFSV